MKITLTDEGHIGFPPRQQKFTHGRQSKAYHVEIGQCSQEMPRRREGLSRSREFSKRAHARIQPESHAYLRQLASNID